MITFFFLQTIIAKTFTALDHLMVPEKSQVFILNNYIKHWLLVDLHYMALNSCFLHKQVKTIVKLYYYVVHYSY